LASGHEEPYRPPNRISNSVQLGVHTAFGPSYQAPALPFLPVGVFCESILLGCITPAQAIAIDEDNTAQNASVISTRHTMALRKVRAKPHHLILAQAAKIAHKSPLNLGV
jgi:hypothetical protein